MNDPFQQFADAITSAGLTPPEHVEADGALHRFASNGKRGDDAGYYVLHLDGVPAGHFGCWRTGVSQSWRADIGRKLSPVEAIAHQERVEKMRREREAEQERRQAEARELAARLWKEGAPASPAHPYLERKGARPYGVKERGGLLLVPMRDAGNVLHSLQTIGPDGDKRFLPGGRVTGCYHAFGKAGDSVCVVEGYATGASVQEATGYPVAVAFNAGNLETVARALRAKMPAARIILCADDDAATPGNPGVTKATEAALAIGGLLALPDFGDARPQGATDFNDMARYFGAEAVKRAVERAAAPDAREPVPSAPDAPGADSAGAWPVPAPIRTELHPVPAFDAAALLPDVLREWVSDEAERMPCPPDFVAVAGLVALGAVVGARCAIKPKARDSWLVVPNLWGGIVAPPSAKKSPAIGAAMKPLDRLAAKASEAYRAECDAFEATRLVREAQGDALKAAIKSAAKKPGGNPGLPADELRQHNAQAPDAPTLRRFVTNDSTVEKLGELLRDNPTGILVLRDELVGLLASWEREGHEGDRAFYLEGWNGTGAFNTDRIGRGNVSIPHLCLSVFGGIQPDKLTGYLEEAADALGNDGMLQRFQLLVYPDGRVWEWRDYAPNARAREAVYAMFEALADFDAVAWGAQSADAVCRFPHFRFDAEAQAVFIEWATELHKARIPAEQADGHPLMAQHLAKYEKLFAALALVLHLADCAATGRRGPVSERAALRAAGWCEFLEAHARRCYGLLADKGARAAQTLAERVRSGALADGFTARDVKRKQWRHLSNDLAVRDALEWLEADGWIRALPPAPDATGRPTVRYLVNPNSARTRRAPTDKTDETPVSAVLAGSQGGAIVETEAEIG